MTHDEAMKDRAYAVFHNKYYHGPAHLNINAMQMRESDDKKQEEQNEQRD